MPVPDLLVLAGGFGTRLRSAVAAVPKPLAPVNDRPYLHYLLEHWLEQGVRSLTFLLHHQAGLIESYLESQREAGLLQACEVRTLTEPMPLGTGGAIAHAVQRLRLTGSFLVANADTWLGTGIEQVAATAAPAMAMVRVDSTERYGSVRTQRDKVIEFAEKQHSSGPGWINAGLYHLDAALFRDWQHEPFSLEGELFPSLASAGTLSAVPLQTEFVDIGVPPDYLRFCRWVEAGKAGQP